MESLSVFFWFYLMRANFKLKQPTKLLKADMTGVLHHRGRPCTTKCLSLMHYAPNFLAPSLDCLDPGVPVLSESFLV